MASNRFDQPYRPIRFRDAQSTFVPQEFVNTNVDEAYVPLPLEGIEKQYTGLQSKFDQSQKNIAAENQKIKDYGLEYVNAWGRDLPVNHKQKVAERHNEYRTALREASDQVAAGDMNALNKVDTLAANYAADPYLNYARKAEETDKKYAEEIQKAKLAGDEHRANQIYMERLQLFNDPNNEADLAGNALVEDKVDREAELNRTFEGLASNKMAQLDPYSLTGSDLGFLKQTVETVDPNNVGNIYDLAVRNNPQLMNDFKQEGLAYAYKLSMLDPKDLEGSEAVLDDKGKVDIMATANKHINETYSEMRAAQMRKRSFTKVDKSVTNHDWFYQENKAKAGAGAKEATVEDVRAFSEGPVEVINEKVIDDKGNIKMTDSRNSVVQSRARLDQIDNVLKDPNMSSNVRNSLLREKANLEAQSGFLNTLVEQSHARVTPQELASQMSDAGIGKNKDHFLLNIQNSARSILGLPLVDNGLKQITSFGANTQDVNYTIQSRNNYKVDESTPLGMMASEIINAKTYEEYASVVKKYATSVDFDKFVPSSGKIYDLGSYFGPSDEEADAYNGLNLLSSVQIAVKQLDELAQPHIQQLYNHTAATHIMTIEPLKQTGSTQSNYIEAQLNTIGKGGWAAVPVKGQTEADVQLYGDDGLLNQGYTVNIAKSKNHVVFSNDWKKAGNKIVLSKEGAEDKTVLVYPMNEADTQEYARKVAGYNQDDNVMNVTNRVTNGQLWSDQFDNFPDVGIKKAINYSFKNGVTSPIAEISEDISPIDNQPSYKVYIAGQPYKINGISSFNKDETMSLLTAIKEQLEPKK